MTVEQIPTFKLSQNGNTIPAIAFGSGTAWKSPHRQLNLDQPLPLNEPLIESLTNAIVEGFTHIDTAEAYLTHAEVAEGIKRSGVDRGDLFITDKYSASSYSRTASSGPYESATTALKELGLDYLDLYLLHIPKVPKELPDATLKGFWLEVEKLYKEGLAKNIGVSNFSVDNLKEILEVATVKPQVNQIEYHPYLQNQTPGIKRFNDENDILSVAFSPLVPILKAKPGPLDGLLAELTQKYAKTEPQILLRWVYQNGVLPLTTSSKKERLQDALGIFKFELEQADFEKISELGKKKFFRGAIQSLFAPYDDDLKKELGLNL